MAGLRLRQLEAFVAVAEQGSFRRAADRLNTTQPNISARIAALEAQLGQRVMDRDAGRVALTPVVVLIDFRLPTSTSRTKCITNDWTGR